MWLRDHTHRWVGHLVIEFVERLSGCWGFRARSTFQMHLKNGAISAITRQDYEYFDRTSPGVLQERLNRDAEALGQNLINFPQRMFEKVAWSELSAPPRTRGICRLRPSFDRSRRAFESCLDSRRQRRLRVGAVPAEALRGGRLTPLRDGPPPVLGLHVELEGGGAPEPGRRGGHRVDGRGAPRDQDGARHDRTRPYTTVHDRICTCECTRP